MFIIDIMCPKEDISLILNAVNIFFQIPLF